MSTRAMLVSAASALGSLVDDVVFTGGATISEYADDVPLVGIRPTADVDVVVRLALRSEYYAFMSRLDELHWSHPQMEGDHPICRRRTPGGLLVDVMPSDVDVLGFTNRWYAYGFDRLTRIRLAPSLEVNLFPPDVLIASKLEAFNTRGNSDWYVSHDLEDVISVLEARSSIVNEIATAPSAVRDFVASWARDLIALPDCEQIVEAHLHPVATNAGRLAVVLDRVRAIATLSG